MAGAECRGVRHNFDSVDRIYGKVYAAFAWKLKAQYVGGGHGFSGLIVKASPLANSHGVENIPVAGIVGFESHTRTFACA